jgi:hypothetical protein
MTSKMRIDINAGDAASVSKKMSGIVPAAQTDFKDLFPLNGIDKRHYGFVGAAAIDIIATAFFIHFPEVPPAIAFVIVFHGRLSGAAGRFSE